jgi:hypothetical protein
MITKKNLIILGVCISILTLTAFSFDKLFQETEIPYPDGYRYWVHIKTGLVGPQSPFFNTTGGYHHIYGNAKAMQGYTSGHFPEGSVIVFDVLNMKEQGGNIQEDGRNHLDVMVKDSLKYASTGGWGYEEFKGDSHTERTLTQATKMQCSSCHAKMEDHVFSEFRK